jgi:large subunit ribosomal protein L23
LRRVGVHYGRRSGWKKAFVTVHPNDSIDLYGEE